jgi:hypothetical protein
MDYIKCKNKKEPTPRWEKGTSCQSKDVCMAHVTENRYFIRFTEKWSEV